MQDLTQLFWKYLNGQCSRPEIGELMEYFNLLSNDEELSALVEQAMQENEGPSGTDDLEITEILYSNRKAVMTAVEKPTIKIPLYIKILAAACMIILAAAVTYLLYRDMAGPRVADKTAQIYDIMPGSNKATLTLSDGRVISLSGKRNSNLTSDGGSNIAQTADGRLIYTAGDKQEHFIPLYNVVSTPKGGQYQIELPDGTKVWLNAASSLTYTPSLITSGMRKVKLSGEAYFEVAHDAAHPFIVSSNGQDVRVLGTHFNINSYADEPATVTTLTEGSVQVQSDKTSIKIKPGQQSLLSTDHFLNLRQADIGLALSWKNGDIAFQDAGIKEVMRQLARWYDLDVEYRGPIPDDTITGTISRSAHLLSVLKMFRAMEIHFEMQQEHERKKLIVYK